MGDKRAMGMTTRVTMSMYSTDEPARIRRSEGVGRVCESRRTRVPWKSSDRYIIIHPTSGGSGPFAESGPPLEIASGWPGGCGSRRFPDLRPLLPKDYRKSQES